MPAKRSKQPTAAAPRLVLVDGHSLIYRSFMVFQGSRNSAPVEFSVKRTGEITTAVYGFTSTLLSVLDRLQPTHLAVALDAPAKTFRHEKDATYKATRAAMPDDLKRQAARIREVLDAFKMPVFEEPGFEADDVLGTLARQARAQGVDTYVATLDSDLLQLVEPGVQVFMYRPYIKAAPAVTYDEAGVRERYGLEPAQIPDYKGLKGDTSDNIAGVPGIGEKTATRLLQQFGSVEAIYDRIDEVTPEKLRANLREHEQQARVSKDMATIERAAPTQLDLEACRLQNFDRERVETLFHELEFRSLIPRIPDQLGEAQHEAKRTAVAAARHYRTIRDRTSLDALVNEARASGRIAVHVENSDANGMRGLLVGIAVATKPGEAAYIPVGHQLSLEDGDQLAADSVLDALRPLLEDAALTKVTHNGHFDALVLANHGVEMRGMRFDTMIAAYLLGEQNMSVQTLAFDRLHMQIPLLIDLIGRAGKNQITMSAVALDTACDYCCAHGDAQLQAADVLAAELRQRNLWPLFDDVEMPLMAVLARMEGTGVAVDQSILVAMSREMQDELETIEREIYASVGHEFNIGSPQQLSQVLFGEIGLPKTRKTKLGYTTDAVSMEQLREAHPVIGLILRHRAVAKLKGTYVDALPALVNPKTHRIHTTFNQTTAATGRLSSNDPNLQNIPVRTGYGNAIRRAFIARDIGDDPMLLAADYSQVELRIMAHLSQDPALIEAFRSDTDIHAATASNVFAVALDDVSAEQRRRAKVFNFGVLYGLSEYGLSTKERISREEAAEFIRRYFERYASVRGWRDGAIESCRRLGYAETLMGRRRYIPEIRSSNFQVRSSGERMAINMPVQGTASDIIKVAMNRIDEEISERGMRSRMILQVHDELIFEGPRSELDDVREMCLRIMPQSLDLVVPLVIDVKTGKNWGELEVARGPLAEEEVLAFVE
ncbi:MAG: DNA polymerase I [Dehalococcoidia bacterium]|nr:DNA polymerase I [Dehalococcoidia bacterium]